MSDSVLNRYRDTNDGDQELADAHPDGTDHEQSPSTEPLDTPHPRESHEDADDVEGDSDQEGVGNPRVLEKCGTIIGDEVDASELLPGLDEDTGKGTEKDSVVGGTEAVSVRRLAQFLLVFEGNTDLVEFSLELGMVGREGDETGESTGGILVALLLDEPSRGLGEEDHADGENKCPDELDRDGELPRSVSGFALGSIVDDGGEEETDRDCPLITGDDGTTVLDPTRE